MHLLKSEEFLGAEFAESILRASLVRVGPARCCSKNDVLGSTTLANFAVSLMKIACTTRNSSEVSAFFACSVFCLGGKITRLVHRVSALERRAPRNPTC